MCGSTEHGASYHTPDSPATAVAKKRVRMELGGSETDEMTPKEKAANLRAGRSDKKN